VDCGRGARRLSFCPKPSTFRETAMRSKRDAIIGAVLATAVSFGANLRAGAAELTTFRVGEAAPANTFLAIWVAQAAGFYEAEGLKLEIVHMAGGRDSGPDLKSGRVQLIHIGMSSVVRANLAGGSLRNVGSLSNVFRATMFAAPGVATNAELKGKV